MSEDKNKKDFENTMLDPLSLANMRLTQNFDDKIGVKKKLVTVPVRKPHRQEFVRVHPDEEFRIQTAVIEDKLENETYIVSPEMYTALPEEVVPKVLLTSINRQGVLFLWPIRLSGSDGKLDKWNQSALSASEIGKQRWVRVASNRGLGAYDVFEASSELSEPEWPEYSFQEIIRIAFADNVISDPSHPIVKRLRGEI